MSAYEVILVEDETSPGCVAVRIAGLRALPIGATLRISPGDEQASPQLGNGWPWGEIMPRRVSATRDGLDVILGPEVARYSKLMAGTPVKIGIDAVRLEADAVWPALLPALLHEAQVRDDDTSTMQALAERLERERREKEAAARRRQQAETAASLAREAAAAASTRPKPAAYAVNNEFDRPPTSQLAQLLPTRRGSAFEPYDAAIDEQRAVTLAPPERSGALTTSNNIPVVVHRDSGQRGRRGASLRGFFAGAFTAVGLGLAFASLAPPQWLSMRVASAPVAAEPQIGVGELQAVFKDVNSAGAISPRGQPAASVDVAAALALADQNLRGQRSPTENEEAEFWLKRALGARIGGEDVGWALTQLGTIYAQSEQRPRDYAKARTLWEMAAAQGDPVAHCFLGSLYEHGLGLKADRQLARRHFEMAGAHGACRGAADAAERLKD